MKSNLIISVRSIDIVDKFRCVKEELRGGGRANDVPHSALPFLNKREELLPPVHAASRPLE